MHSSGMRTARLLTVSQDELHGGVHPSMHWGCVSQHALGRGGVCPGGVPARGVPGQAGVPAQEVYLSGVYPSMQWGRPLPPPVDRQTFVKT